MAAATMFLRCTLGSGLLGISSAVLCQNERSGGVDNSRQHEREQTLFKHCVSLEMIWSGGMNLIMSLEFCESRYFYESLLDISPNEQTKLYRRIREGPVIIASKVTVRRLGGGLMMASRRLVCRPLLLGLTLSLVLDCARAQSPPAPTPSTPATGGTIHGVVRSGNMPIPGAAVSVSVESSDPQIPAQKISVWTDVDGSYSATVPAYGSYTVRVQMIAFANATRKFEVNASHQDAQENFVLTLQSRSQEAGAQPARPGAQAPAQRGFQSLSAMQGAAGQDSGGAISDVVPSGMPVPGIDPNGATESIAVSGNSSNSLNSMSGDELQQRINDARQQGGGFGGGGFGGGGFGGGGAGRPMTITGRRGFDINHPHGSIYYGIGDSALNAAPYALAGEPATKPGYLQNSFGGSIGGPLNIPKIYHGGTKTFFFVNYNGKRAENPFDQFSTVPTLLERQGNFSQTTYPTGQPVEIFNPATNTPFPCNPSCNTIPQINPAAQGLLQYIPLPNLPGSTQNFHYVTAATSDSDDLNVRVNHSFGAAPAGGRRGGGGRNAPRNSLQVGFHYHQTTATLTNPFPSVGGSTTVRSFDIPV